MNWLKKLNPKKLFSWLIQIIIFFAIFYGIMMWQQKDMLQKGQTTPISNITLLSVDGVSSSFELNDQQTNTLIYFFAPWCNVCHASIDNLEKIKQSKHANLNILVVALDWQSLNEVDNFLAKHQLTMPILLGTEQILKDFKISGFPSYYIIAKDGTIAYKNMGYSTELGLRLAINTIN